MKKIIFLIVFLMSGIWSQAQVLLHNNQIIITQQSDGVYIEPSTPGDSFIVHMDINKVNMDWMQFNQLEYLQPLEVLENKTLYLTLHKYNTSGLNRIGKNEETRCVGVYSIEF